MFNILVDFKLSKKIKIEKLGLVFRPLTNKEKEMLLEQVNLIYTKNKSLINQAVKKYDKNEKFKLQIDLLKYDDSTQKIVLFGFMMLKDGISINTPAKVKKVLDQLIIIDYDKKILFEYIQEQNVIKLISNLLSLYDIYSKDINFNEKVRPDYSYILTDNILNPKEENYDLNILLNLLANMNKKMKKMVELSEEYLLQLKNFFSKLKIEEIRRFLNTIDLLYSNHSMIQNSIVNNVTILEGILINEDEDIKSNYVLKAGLILNHYIGNHNRVTNKFIKDFLNYSYDIRSAIVHGNDEKILSLFNKVVQKNKNIKDLVHDDVNKYNNKKIQSLCLADTISFMAVRAVIKYWIDFPNIVSFMKDK